MSYDAGALLFKIQTVGAQVFRQETAAAEKSIEKTGAAAQSASGKVNQLGTSTDETGKAAKSAKAPLDEQAKSTKGVGDESEKAQKKQERQKYTTEEQAEAARKLSNQLLIAGTATAALVTLSVAKYAEFDTQMSNVRAATMATAAEQKALGDAALEAGADTAYSATEAAAAEEELAKAGLSVAEIVGGSLNGSLALAAAGQLQVARSAEIMATTLKQYRLEGEQSAHVSDLLAAGAGKAQGSVDDLALALQYVGPVAAGLGISLEETTGTLALFASQGQLGERAGTGLRGVLMSLTSPSALAAKTMKQYNVEIFDGNGNMKSLAEVSQQLKTAFGGLTEAERSAALGRIFGNEQITAARVLYEGGADAVTKWTDEVNDSGYAAEQAAMRQDNLAGDIEKLGGAFDTALIQSGSAANDVLRGMVQGLTALVDMFGEAPEPVQQTALVLGAAAAATLLLAGGAVKARASFIELKTQLDATNTSMRSTALLGGAAGLALTGIITVVGLLAAKQAEAQQKAQSYADAIESGADAVRGLAEANLQAETTLAFLNFGSAYDNADKLGISLNAVTDAATGNAKAMEEVNAVLDVALGGGEAATKMADDLGISYLDLSQSAGTLRDQIAAETDAQKRANVIRDQAARAATTGAESSEEAADAYLAEADSVEDLNSQLSQLIDQINESNGVNQDAITASSNYQQALADVDEQVKKINDGVDGYTKTLNLSTQAGRDNMRMLQGQAEDAQDAAAAQYELDGNTDAYIERLKKGRDTFIENARRFGATEEEAKALADQVFRIPSQKEIDILANTTDAKKRLDNFITQNNGRRIYVKVSTDGTSIRMGSKTISIYGDGGVRYNADGNVYRSEHHVAQIARAGDYRVWAEPETGGESYVPHALSKRARSEQIMSETARILGGTYIPAGARSFANGSSGEPVIVGGNTYFVTASFPAVDPRIAARLFTDELRDGLAAQ